MNGFNHQELCNSVPLNLVAAHPSSCCHSHAPLCVLLLSHTIHFHNRDFKNQKCFKCIFLSPSPLNCRTVILKELHDNKAINVYSPVLFIFCRHATLKKKTKDLSGKQSLSLTPLWTPNLVKVCMPGSFSGGLPLHYCFRKYLNITLGEKKKKCIFSIFSAMYFTREEAEPGYSSLFLSVFLSFFVPCFLPSFLSHFSSHVILSVNSCRGPWPYS